jgi:cytochrome P450
MTFSYDPYDLNTLEDPYPAYKVLRDQYPIYYIDRYNVWAVSRFEDVRAISRDFQRFTTSAGVDIDHLGDALIGEGNFLEMDPPRHDSFRNVVRSRFSPRSVKSLEAKVRSHCLELLDPIRERGSGDLAKEFAWVLPMRMICEILGVPSEDHAALGQLYGAMSNRVPGEPEIPPAAHEAATQIRAYLGASAKQRRQAARDDVMSDIAIAKVDGKRLTEPEIVGMCMLLFVAGISTTGSLISNSLALLHRHPEQRAVLMDAAAEPNVQILEAAIEEFLRFETPVQNMLRTTSEDVKMHKTTLPKGTRVTLLFGSANRDEREFDNPDQLDVTRSPRRHLAFGEGIHFCIGSVLARLEGRIAFECVLKTLPQYEVSGPVERSHRPDERGIVSLPVTW